MQSVLCNQCRAIIEVQSLLATGHLSHDGHVAGEGVRNVKEVVHAVAIRVRKDVGGSGGVQHLRVEEEGG